MNTTTNSTNQTANNTGFPPVPPKAHQKASCKTPWVDHFTSEEMTALGWTPEQIRDQQRWNLCAGGSIVLCRHEEMGVIVFGTPMSDGRYVAKGYYAKRMKEDFFYLFKTEEQAHGYVDRWIKEKRLCAEYKQTRKAERRANLAKPHQLKVGDVLSSVWGYEQTNVDYYEVVALKGKRTVVIRQISSDVTSTAWMQGTCTPNKGHYVSGLMEYRVSEQGNSIRLNSFSSASLEVPKIVDGEETYAPRHWTSYA